MPIITCTTRAGLNVDVKRSIAKQITATVHDTIKSNPAIISVVFNDLSSESSYVNGEPGSDTLIMCNIRGGRSAEAKHRLVRTVSKIWSDATGQDENNIEVGLLEFDPDFIYRGGKVLPGPPKA